MSIQALLTKITRLSSFGRELRTRRKNSGEFVVELFFNEELEKSVTAVSFQKGVVFLYNEIYHP